MFAKNLKYYRLKNNYSKKSLASIVGVSPMAITHYENGERYPEMAIIKELAKALNIKVGDFLAVRNQNLNFVHGNFRKNRKLSKSEQDYIRESVEEYFGRFFDAVEILGGEVLTDAPCCNTIELSDDDETNARALRHYLDISEAGPIGNMVELLENKGILVFMLDISNDDFSGMNGTINGRPYIVVNKNMSTERIRSTIGHEIAHFAFRWPEGMNEKEEEQRAMSISGAFLFPSYDAYRKLGYKRRTITNDMVFICKEYGIALSLLVVRAFRCNIISEMTYKNYFIMLNKNHGSKKNEPNLLEYKEESHLFEQLVYRAVNEEGLSIQRGAELLKSSYDSVVQNCKQFGV